MIALHLSDWDYLEALDDLEDLGYTDILVFNLKLRIHLSREKRQKGLFHLKQIN